MRKLLIFWFYCLLIFCCSCSPSLEKAIMTTTKTQVNAETTQNAIHKVYPGVTAVFYARTYPIRETSTTIIDTLRVPVEVKGDSIPCPQVVDKVTGKSYTPMVKCPDLTYYATTIREQKETIQESSASLEVAHIQADTLQAKLTREQTLRQIDVTEKEAYKDERNKAYWALGILALLIGAGLVAKFLLRK